MEPQQEEKHQAIAELEDQVMSLQATVINYQHLIDGLEYRVDVQEALNALLEISLEPISLEEQLDRILQKIIGVRWLALKRKGLIFLRDGEKDQLRIAAHHGVSESLTSLCHKVPFGHCLCGRAASSRAPLFKSCVDHDHERQPSGMMPHGHHVLPGVVDNKTEAVICLYVPHGHQQSALEQEFLQACSHVVSGIIRRRQLEQHANYDSLTGMLNRRGLEERLSQAIDRADRRRTPMAILFIDLDRFKPVNDELGH